MNIKWKTKGSLTVEATLVFPLFFFLIIGFLYFFQIFSMQVKIQGNLTELAQEASRYGYLYDTLTISKNNEASEEKSQDVKEEVMNVLTGLAEGSYYKYRFGQLMENYENVHAIDGGLEGISFFGSAFMGQDGEILVVASYKITIPVPFFSGISFPVTQQVKTRGFIGTYLKENQGDEEAEDEEDEYVYITRTGKVYHVTKSCTYLSPKIHCVTASSLENLRNKSGAKYYPCESCAEGKKNRGSYYITEYGNRYHTSKLCNKIERDIRTIKKSEVGSRKPCSKCCP